jgi:mRNA-degrading endonuclease RelE of RelBE toxin-antitoxin system
MPEVRFSRDAAGEFDDLPLSIQSRVLKLIERLEKWPEGSGAKPLTGALAGSYRLRTGDYRMQFHLQNDKIIVDKVGHRDGFYE